MLFLYLSARCKIKTKESELPIVLGLVLQLVPLPFVICMWAVLWDAWTGGHVGLEAWWIHVEGSLASWGGRGLVGAVTFFGMVLFIVWVMMLLVLSRDGNEAEES